MTITAKIDTLNQLAAQKSITEMLAHVSLQFQGTAIFTTSFGYEDQAITHLIFGNNLPIKVVTLDTGRLFKETYKVYSQTLEVYKKEIVAFYPKHEALEQMVTQKGPYSFYHSTDNRKECCNIRKVEPLDRALQGVECWITGIRAEQSPNRQGMVFFELDEPRNIIKYNPLLHWTFNEVKQFVKDNNVPYNVLHDKNFVSIGCEPCTRAIQPGEDFRAGRWWWETDSKKECGLHTHQK
jgi:phosphoadenosine phosphosulfate reductase